MAQIMQLWEAISLGRVLVKPISRGEWYFDGSGCARGMALEAVGKRCQSTNAQNYIRFERLWPWTTSNSRYPCECSRNPDPVLNTGVSSISVIITHLFDEHVERWRADAHVIPLSIWTLERLIDWVRSVEPEPEPEPEALPASSESQAVQGAR